jgi:single-strand DNA-binding protein
MMDINKAILIGRLGTEPVTRATQQGLSVANFSMATSRRVRSAAEEGAYDQETQWHRVVVWGKQADFCSKYLKKGQAVYVEGAIRSRRYKTEEGEEKSISEIHAERLSLLTAKKPQSINEGHAETEVSAELN